MRAFIFAISCFLLTACSVCHQYPELSEDPVYNNDREGKFEPARGKIFHVAGFDIEQGQQMQDFFDDFDVPLHTSFEGDIVEWTYAIDYNGAKDKGKIVRYCDVAGYGKPLCTLKVTFNHTYVENATSNCR
ncbi:MAG: hypothetical protein IJ864_02690 [Alphaproteobacteria bacterium]|nr:hypothetical protein [Alphaproteobacteria bacterium]